MRKFKKKKIRVSRNVRNINSIQWRCHDDMCSVCSRKTPELMLSDRCIIYRSELDFIKRCISRYPNIETGGQLFGFWTAKGTPVVLYAIGPGPNAKHYLTFFMQDIDYLREVGNRLVKHYGLKHIGEWHSHHRLGLAQPSGHDSKNMQTSVDEAHLSRFLLCIGNINDVEITVNPFNFSENAAAYTKANWDIQELESPFRKIIDAQ